MSPSSRLSRSADLCKAVITEGAGESSKFPGPAGSSGEESLKIVVEILLSLIYHSGSKDTEMREQVSFNRQKNSSSSGTSSSEQSQHVP